MILNTKQEKALIEWATQHSKLDPRSLTHDVHRLAIGEVRELRIISEFGMAGKLWNNNGKIYVSGYYPSEISKNEYNKQRKRIDKLNAELLELMERSNEP